MAEALVSGSWYRVAPLKPSLVAGLKIVRHEVRDQVWHILVEPGSGRQLRLNPAAYAFAGRCNGNATVESLWTLLLERKGDDAPTQDDILRLLAQLFRAGMVQFDAAPYLSLLFSRRSEEGQRKRRAFINPLMVRMKLFDPTRLLDRLAPLAALLGRWSVFALWLLAVALGALAAAVNFPQLKAEALRVLATPSSYALAWVCYPVVKTLHEIAHAMAVRRFGGAVHEMGISLVFLTPAPYVDASAANGFASARQRAIVSAAGIMVELALAAAAIAAWLVLSPGLLRDGALAVLLICSVSTIVFNANPLLRLDGYHLLCDALQLPNLALRSQGWWTTQWRRLIGAEGALPPSALAKGELKWLVLYAPASWIYRLGLLFALVFWLGHQSWLMGWLAGLLVLGWLVKAVLAALLRSVAESADPGARRRALVAASAIALGSVLALFVLPVPSSVVARGVVWPPERAQLRAESAGFVEGAMARDGSPVMEGDVVLTLADPVLAAQRDKTDSEKSGLMAQQYTALLQDPARAAELGEDLARNDAELQRADQQLADLQLRAKTGGRTVWPHERDLPGSFAQRGTMLGYVLSPEPAQVRAVLRDEDMLRVRGRVKAIEVRLAEAPLTPHAAQLRNETPAATRQLPSAALGDRQGGPVSVDPADKDGLRTQLPVFLLDVLVPSVTPDHIGGRAWVKLVLEDEPLGLQGLRVLRQLLVRQFSPTGQT
ncbi:PqqD family peptide modification chaperone [Caenimonas terrae]|uniref:PqqD family peptide modification chaperone n=1 Tax=Caenimonas terrae TaxID=696074 RepID=A0ABW0NIB5_9BURK